MSPRAMGSATEKVPLVSQYHHFIPQFILRKYSDFERLRADNVPLSKAKKRSKVTMFNLEKGVFECNRSSRTFGVQDMYRDIDEDTINKFELEEKLGALEKRAAKILSNVETAYKCGDSSVTLNRADKDELRRFLFIMLYRNRIFENRYEKSKEEYDADDRAPMMRYMEKHGYQVPKAVWFANMRAFIDVPLGHDFSRWSKEILESAYPLDAEWFIGHLTNTFLSFCCPTANSSDEFVLTQNAYSIFEGPNQVQQWTDWHVFAPISPRITIVMRKNMLQKRALPKLESHRKAVLAVMLSACFEDATAVESNLVDLPLEVPQTSYPSINSTKKPLSQRLSNNDTFTFKFIRLCSDHLQRINSIFLEEALETKGIVFHNREGFRRALEAYFVLDPIRFKKVASNPKLSARSSAGLAFGLEKNEWIQANREKYLKLLENAAAQLGSSVQPRYFDQNGKFFNWLVSIPARFSTRYRVLGGDIFTTLVTDLIQANAITDLVTGTDVLLQNKGPEFKHHVRQHRTDLLVGLPARRLWLHLRQLRGRVKSKSKDEPLVELQKLYLETFDGVEDSMIDAYRVFDPIRFAQTFYEIAQLDLYLHMNPDFGTARAGTSFKKPFHQLKKERLALLSRPGSINKCRIPKLEREASRLLASQRTEQASKKFSRDPLIRAFFPKELQLELWLRSTLYDRFESILGSDLTFSEAKSLKAALFGLLYRYDFTGT